MSTWYIPARTGPTLDRCRFMRWEGVYPCSHRANQARRTLPTTAPGISLLTRGQRAERCPLGPCIGYIPARTGPTLGRTPLPMVGGVYPCSHRANPCGVMDSITKCSYRCPVSGHPCLRAGAALRSGICRCLRVPHLVLRTASCWRVSAAGRPLLASCLVSVGD